MTKQQAMEYEITYWIEELGFDAVIEAVGDACHAISTAEHTPPAKTATLERQYEAIRMLQWDLTRPRRSR